MWYDQDSGTYRMTIENEGNDKQCDTIGRPIHKYDPSLTGRYQYKSRIMLMKQADPNL